MACGYRLKMRGDLQKQNELCFYVWTIIYFQVLNLAVMRSQMSAGRRAARNSYSGRGQGSRKGSEISFLSICAGLVLISLFVFCVYCIKAIDFTGEYSNMDEVVGDLYSWTSQKVGESREKIKSVNQAFQLEEKVSNLWITIKDKARQFADSYILNHFKRNSDGEGKNQMMIETNETVIETQVQISEVKQGKKELVKTVVSKESKSNIAQEQKTNVPKEEASKEQIVIESSREQDNSVLTDSKEEEVQVKIVFEEKKVVTAINKGSNQPSVAE